MKQPPTVIHHRKAQTIQQQTRISSLSRPRAHETDFVTDDALSVLRRKLKLVSK